MGDHPVTADLAVDLFAGPGGWDEGARLAGLDGPLYGYELDAAACSTGQAAGHQRIRTDVAGVNLDRLAGRVRLLLGSPPCTAFSNAGTGAGRALFEILATATTRIIRGRDPGRTIAAARRAARRALRPAALKALPKSTRVQRAEWITGQVTTAVLVLEPARWIVGTRPDMVALEQVPSVLPLWRHLGAMLRELGYRTWCGTLHTEEYGVPQTRRRAVLTASRVGPVGRPVTTHQRYRTGVAVQTEPDLFGDPLPAPVSMARALGWDLDGAMPALLTAGRTKVLDRTLPRPATSPAPAITFGHADMRWTEDPAGTAWQLRNGNQANACTRTPDEPAGTLYFGQRANAVDWVRDRPATTVQGDPRIWPPGHKVNADDTARLGNDEARHRYGDRAGTESVRVTVVEAGILQGFRKDYPWRGTQTNQYSQVGNAVPPPLAAAVLRPLIRGAR